MPPDTDLRGAHAAVATTRVLTDLVRRLFGGWGVARRLADARRRVDEGDLRRADRLCVEMLPRVDGTFAADLHRLRGTIALRERRIDAAIRHFRDALTLCVADSGLHLGIADAYRELRDLRNEAAHVRAALDVLPQGDASRPRLMLRLAGSLYEQGLLAEAERWYRRLLEIDPDHGDALLCLSALREAFDVEEARSLMDRYVILRRDAAPRLRRALMLPTIVQSEDEIESIRRRLDCELDEVLDGRWPVIRHPEYEIGSTGFALAYHGRNDRELLTKLARACRAVYPARTVPPARPYGHWSRLRVGFVSTYFHSHSIARTHSGFIAGLPRDQFEVYVFAIAPKQDDWARTIRESAEHYVALPPSIDRAREAIERADLDILFYTDIGMDPHTYFLAFWRLAPIQLVSWGHPVTTGIDTIDYFVSAEGLETPGSDNQYSEALYRLPEFFMPRYRRPAIAALADARCQLGVPADTRIYCCLQNLFKLHPEFDLALKGILEGDACAQIVLLESLSNGATDQLRRRLTRTLGPLEDRVRFVPRMGQTEYQQFVAAADVVLDPFHFGGANSSCEPLALGVPVVTLPAFQLRGRFTLGMYDEIGLSDCVARSREDFVAIALRLGREPGYRAELSRRIAARSDCLFNRLEAGRVLGEALLQLPPPVH